MAENLSGEEIAEYRECFNVFDTNGDGSINKEELGNVLRTLGNNPTEKDLDEMMGHLDVNGNGTIDFPEFIAMMVPKLSTEISGRGLNAIFKNHDKDNTGLISTDDLRKILQPFGEIVTKEEIETIVVDVDSDNDGQVNFTEFETAVNLLAEEKKARRQSKS